MKALILTWEKFQDHETVYPYYALKQHGFEVTLAANKRNERVFGSLGVHLVSDIHVDDLSFGQYTSMDGNFYRINDYDLLVIPGGVKCLEKLRLEKNAVHFVREWFEDDKPTMSICNGAQLLITADVLRGRKCSGYYSIEPDIRNAGAKYSRDPVVVDGNLVSCPHYDFMGEWMNEGLKMYENSKQKTVGL
jgi:protease I